MPFDPTNAPRLAPAWRTILQTLADNAEHPHQQLTAAARGASDLAPKTIENLIRRGWRTGHYRRRGTPQQPPAGALYRLPPTSSPPRPDLVPEARRATSSLVPKCVALGTTSRTSSRTSSRDEVDHHT